MLTANYESSRINRENLLLPNSTKISKKPEVFCRYFFAVLGSELNFQSFQKQISLTAQVFLKLLTARDVLV